MHAPAVCVLARMQSTFVDIIIGLALSLKLSAVPPTLLKHWYKLDKSALIAGNCVTFHWRTAATTWSTVSGLSKGATTVLVSCSCSRRYSPTGPKQVGSTAWRAGSTQFKSIPSSLLPQMVPGMSVAMGGGGRRRGAPPPHQNL